MKGMCVFVSIAMWQLQSNYRRTGNTTGWHSISELPIKGALLGQFWVCGESKALSRKTARFRLPAQPPTHLALSSRGKMLLEALVLIKRKTPAESPVDGVTRVSEPLSF
jgi:hypothetical protein